MRPPRLVGAPEDPEEPAFEMPGVLTRGPSAAPAATFASKNLSAKLERGGSRTDSRKGPRFRTLPASSVLAGAVLAVAAIGAAAYFMTGSRSGPDSARTVETSSIETVPTIESLIAAETSAPAVATQDGPSPSQIATAKDRIRDAFASAGRLSEAPEDPSGPAAGPKTQARLAPVPGAGSPDLTAQPTTIAAVSTGAVAATTPRSVVTRPFKPKLAAPTESLPGRPDGSEAETSAALAPDVPAATASPDFANTGKTTAAVNLRKTGDRNGAVVAVIPAGTELRYSECGTWWCNVIYDGQPGFIGQSYLLR
ncbi:MAG: hypothetical protein Tsb0019_09500 [Roseibium sp.]